MSFFDCGEGVHERIRTMKPTAINTLFMANYFGLVSRLHQLFNLGIKSVFELNKPEAYFQIL
jgi:hypothetical protein